MAGLVAFLIPLPSALEFPDGAAFFESNDSDTAAVIGHGSDLWEMPVGCSVRVQFEQIESVRSYVGIEPRALQRLQRSIAPKSRHKLKPRRDMGGCQTVAVAVTRLTDDDISLSPAFDRCLAWVRHLCETWRHTTRYDVLLPEYDTLPVTIMSFTLDEETGRQTPGFMILRTDIIPAGLAAPVDPDAFEDRLGLMLIGLHSRHPQAVFHDRLREARCTLYLHGQRENAVVLASAAIETLVDNTLTCIAWEKGLSPRDAFDSYYKRQGLRQRIRVHLAALLGGDWEPEGTGPVAVWDAELASVRHKVVHEGYLPSRHEAVAALEALSAFEQHLLSRVATRALDYRKTAAIIAAREGLENHEMFTGEFERWVREDMPGDILESYLAWRSQLYALVD